MILDICLTEKQLEFDAAIEKYPVVLFGGARGGGKSFGLRSILLKRRFQYPKSIGYLFRKTFPELEANHIAPLFSQYPELRQYYNESKKILSLPNGSELRFSFLEHKKDLSKFQGREIHDLAIEEAGDWSFEFFQLLRASNRSSISGIEPRTILTANPGGAGHKWLKRLFIEKRFEEDEVHSDYHFVSAKVRDNPALSKVDPGYIKRLSTIKNDVLRRAWLDGDWDVAAGQFYSEFSRDIHVIKPFKIPLHWNWFGSYDYGYNHPFVFQFFVSDEDGNVYHVHEIIGSRIRIDEQVQLVKDFLRSKVESGEKRNLDIVFDAGHDCWAVKKAGSPTITEDFSRYGICFRRAYIDRKQGANQIRMYLAHSRDDNGRRMGPRVFLFENCENTIDCLTRMTHNPNDIEDVLKVDAVNGDPSTGDDPYDAFRYGLMSRPVISVAPRKYKGTTYDDDYSYDRASWISA